MLEAAPTHDLVGLTVQIVTAHVAKNGVPVEALPRLIQDVYRTLAGIGNGSADPAQPVPAVAVRKSVFDDHIVCLEDGKKLKMLKRHLRTVYNLTPQQYRQRWGLPVDYPMVAPDYARRRSALARQSGLGTRRHAPD